MDKQDVFISTFPIATSLNTRDAWHLMSRVSTPLCENLMLGDGYARKRHGLKEVYEFDAEIIGFHQVNDDLSLIHTADGAIWTWDNTVTTPTIAQVGSGYGAVPYSWCNHFDTHYGHIVVFCKQDNVPRYYSISGNNTGLLLGALIDGIAGKFCMSCYGTLFFFDEEEN